MRLILLGGFLGSGKTTAIVNAARILIQQGKRVAIITNDQGDQQVDSAYVRSMNVSVREVGNGCFCCNYQQLDDHVQELMQINPDIIFAESVGTCTDLIATIAKPMSRLRPKIEIVITIFADAAMVSSIIAGSSTFSEESVRYIYKKQLEEADILVLNKIDLINTAELATIDQIIRTEYPGKTILHQSSLVEGDLNKWIIALDTFATSVERQSLEIDYKIYGAGEAQLAWLDKTIRIISNDVNTHYLAQQLITLLAHQIQSRHLAVGHLKFFVESNGKKEKVSVTPTSLASDVKLTDVKATESTILINARVETDPEVLQSIVEQCLTHLRQRFGCRISDGKWSVFKPGFPRPTHRIVV